MAEIVKKRGFSAPQQRPSTNRAVIESEVFDASRKAREIVQEAQEKSEAILNESRAQADAALKNAQEQGYQAGYEQGLQEYQHAIIQVNRQYEDILSQAESQLVKLSVGIAKKIVDEELKVNPEVIIDIVRNALLPMNRKRSITLRVNPKDREILETHRKEFLENMLYGGHIILMSDGDISQGGCVIETEHGSVDARLETQLGVLSQLLTGKAERIELSEEMNSEQQQEEESVYAASISRSIPMNETAATPQIQNEFISETESFETLETPVDEGELFDKEQQDVQSEVEESFVAPVVNDEKVKQSFLEEIDEMSKDLGSEENINDLISSLDEVLGNDFNLDEDE